jgi:hypothetical protein
MSEALLALKSRLSIEYGWHKVSAGVPMSARMLGDRVSWRSLASQQQSRPALGDVEVQMTTTQSTAKRRPPLAVQVLLGLGGLLTLLVLAILVAVVMVVTVRHEEANLSDRDVPTRQRCCRCRAQREGHRDRPARLPPNRRSGIHQRG